MLKRERYIGYVVGSDVTDGEQVWTVRVNFPICKVQGDKFRVWDPPKGLTLASGMDVTFKLALVSTGSGDEQFATELTVFNPVLGDSLLETIQTERNFDLQPSGTNVIATTFMEYELHGGGICNDPIIRKWEICPVGHGFYRACTPKEILRLEAMLGEWPRAEVVVHYHLGPVSKEIK